LWLQFTTPADREKSLTPSRSAAPW